MTSVEPNQRGPLLSAKIIGHQLFIKEHIKEDQKRLHAGKKVEQAEKDAKSYQEVWDIENQGVKYVL